MFRFLLGTGAHIAADPGRRALQTVRLAEILVRPRDYLLPPRVERALSAVGRRASIDLGASAAVAAAPGSASDANRGGPMTHLDTALASVGRGWHVFPCKARSKTPATPRGYLDASNDAARVRKWWTRLPDANIGIACGASGLSIVDCDHGLTTEDEALRFARP